MSIDQSSTSCDFSSLPLGGIYRIRCIINGKKQSAETIAKRMATMRAKKQSDPDQGYLF